MIEQEQSELLSRLLKLSAEEDAISTLDDKSFLQPWEYSDEALSQAMERLKKLGLENPSLQHLTQAAYSCYAEHQKRRLISETEKTTRLKTRVSIFIPGRGWHYLSDAPDSETGKAMSQCVTDNILGGLTGTSKITFCGGVHFKFKPKKPGIEYAIHSLDSLLFPNQAVTNPSLFIKLRYQSGDSIKEEEALATQTVYGKTADKITEESLEFEQAHFTQQCILQLLTAPGDGKLDNFIISKNKLYGIDNEMAFEFELIKGEGKKGHVTFIHTFLFFLPQMKNCLDKNLLEQFKTLSAEKLFLLWLKELEARNTLYERLDKNNLKIIFDQGALKAVYQRLKAIQQFLREMPLDKMDKITGEMLFKAAMPEVFAYYQAINEHLHDQPLQKKIEALQKTKRGDENALNFEILNLPLPAFDKVVTEYRLKVTEIYRKKLPIPTDEEPIPEEMPEQAIENMVNWLDLSKLYESEKTEFYNELRASASRAQKLELKDETLTGAKLLNLAKGATLSFLFLENTQVKLEDLKKLMSFTGCLGLELCLGENDHLGLEAWQYLLHSPLCNHFSLKLPDGEVLLLKGRSASSKILPSFYLQVVSQEKRNNKNKNQAYLDAIEKLLIQEGYPIKSFEACLLKQSDQTAYSLIILSLRYLIIMLENREASPERYLNYYLKLDKLFRELFYKKISLEVFNKDRCQKIQNLIGEYPDSDGERRSNLVKEQQFRQQLTNLIENSEEISLPEERISIEGLTPGKACLDKNLTKTLIAERWLISKTSDEGYSIKVMLVKGNELTQKDLFTWLLEQKIATPLLIKQDSKKPLFYIYGLSEDRKPQLIELANKDDRLNFLPLQNKLQIHISADQNGIIYEEIMSKNFHFHAQSPADNFNFKRKKEKQEIEQTTEQEVEDSEENFLNFKNWYYSRACFYRLHMINNKSKCISILFPDSDCDDNNTITFKKQLQQLVMLSGLLKKPALFMSKEPGAGNHFMCGLVKEKTLLLINPLGIVSHDICYQTLAEIQKENVIERIWLSSTSLQKQGDIEEELKGSIITLELAMHILTSFTSEELDDFWINNLKTDESITDSSLGFIYHCINIENLLPDPLNELVNTINEDDYKDKLWNILQKHCEDLQIVSKKNATNLGVSEESYLSKYKEEVPAQVVFNALITGAKTINDIDELPEYKVLENEPDEKSESSNIFAQTNIVSEDINNQFFAEKPAEVVANEEQNIEEIDIEVFPETLNPNNNNNLSNSDKITSSVQHGNHFVIPIEYKGSKVHCKVLPDFPGMEIAYNLLSCRIMGKGSPQVELWKWTYGQHTYPVLISETIEGENLTPELLKAYPLEEISYQQHVLMSMLVSPGDGNPGNFIAQRIKAPDGSILLRLVSIDNDRLFAPPFETGKLRTATIIYCFDEIASPLHKDLRQIFLSLNAYEVLSWWLNELEKLNQQYCEIFTPEELKKFMSGELENTSSYLLTMLKRETVSELFRKIKTLQYWLSVEPEMHLITLLSKIHPSLANHYQQMRLQYDEPIKRFDEAVKNEYKREEIQGVKRYTSTMHMGQYLKMQGREVNADKTVEKYWQQDFAQAKKELRDLSISREAIELAKAQLIQGNIKDFNDLPEAYAQEEVIASIDFNKDVRNHQGKPDEKRQQEIILLIINCKNLKSLERLIIQHCAITDSQLEELLKRLPKLRILKLTNCPNIMTTFQETFFNSGKLHSKALEECILQDMGGLTNFKLTSHTLRYLSIKQAPNLRTFYFYSNSLTQLCLSNAPQCNQFDIYAKELQEADFSGNASINDLHLQKIVLECKNLKQMNLQRCNEKKIYYRSLKEIIPAFAEKIPQNKDEEKFLELSAGELTSIAGNQERELKLEFRKDISGWWWKCFCVAMAENVSIDKISIMGCTLNQEDIILFSELIKKNQSVTDILLMADMKGDVSFFRAFEHNQTIKKLGLFGNTGDEGPIALAQSLICNQTLKEIVLTCNNISHIGASALFEALEHNQTLEKIDLMVNNIGDKGMIALAKMVEHNHTLSDIGLIANSISDKGVTILAQGLEKNHKLYHIKLEGNSIKDKGIIALVTMFKKSNISRSINIDDDNISITAKSCLQEFESGSGWKGHISLKPTKKIEKAGVILHNVGMTPLVMPMLSIASKIMGKSLVGYDLNLMFWRSSDLPVTEKLSKLGCPVLIKVKGNNNKEHSFYIYGKSKKGEKRLVKLNTNEEFDKLDFNNKYDGQNLHLMLSFPENLEKYRDSYIFNKMELKYVNHDAIADAIKINDLDKLLADIDFINKNKESRIYLSGDEFYELISLNGGHIPGNPYKTLYSKLYVSPTEKKKIYEEIASKEGHVHLMYSSDHFQLNPFTFFSEHGDRENALWYAHNHQQELNFHLEKSLQAWEIPSKKNGDSKNKNHELQQAAHKFGFKCNPIAKDGNCIFEVVSVQLKKILPNQKEYYNHEQLRALSVGYLMKHQAFYENFVDDHSFTNFIRKMSMPGTWAENVVLTALAHIFDVTIVVINSDNSDPIILKKLHARGIIYLGYEVNEHYQSLERDLSLIPQKLLDNYIEYAEILDTPSTNTMKLV